MCEVHEAAEILLPCEIVGSKAIEAGASSFPAVSSAVTPMPRCHHLPAIWLADQSESHHHYLTVTALPKFVP